VRVSKIEGMLARDLKERRLEGREAWEGSRGGVADVGGRSGETECFSL
jgi:hypothetical protein